MRLSVGAALRLALLVLLACAAAPKAHAVNEPYTQSYQLQACIKARNNVLKVYATWDVHVTEDCGLHYRNGPRVDAYDGHYKLSYDYFGGMVRTYRGPKFSFILPGSEEARAEKNAACPTCNGIAPATGNRVEPIFGSGSDGSSGSGGGGAGGGGGGSSFPITFGASYSSGSMGLFQNPSTAGLGSRIRHTYSRSLLPVTGINVQTNQPEEWVLALRPNGNVDKYVRSATEPNAWVSEADNFDVLTQSNDAYGQAISYTLFVRNGDTEAYDQRGLLTAIVHHGSIQYVEHELYYPTASTWLFRLKRVRDESGHELVFDYDNARQLINRVTYPDGSQDVLAYDGDLLTSVTHADGTVRRFLYAEAGLVDAGDAFAESAMTGVIDESGVRYSSTTYDAQHRATRKVLAGGVGEVDVAYSGSSATITNPTGGTTAINHTTILGRLLPVSTTVSCTGCTQRTETMQYDAVGSPDLYTDAAGNVTDSNFTGGLLRQHFAAKGTPIEQETDFLWDDALRVPTLVQVAGRRTELTYNSNAQVLTAKVTDTVTGDARTTTFVYCAGADGLACARAGQLRSINGPRTDVTDLTAFKYRVADAAGCSSSPATCAYRAGDLHKITDAAGRVTEFLAYDGAGRVKSFKDPNGVVTDIERDARGRVTASKIRGTDDTTEADDAITRLEYFPTGLVKKVTLPGGAFATATYDSAHRLTDLADSLGNSIHYTLDAAGRRTAEEMKNGAQVVTQKQSSVFDALGRMTQAKNAAGLATLFSYDANGELDLASDPLNHTFDQDVDALGRINKQVQDLGGIAATSQFAYDLRDNLAQVIDPKGLATTYGYNGFDELVQQTSPDTGATSYTYNAGGLPVSKTDARGIVSSFTWDALGRLTGQQVPTAAQNVAYGYDAPAADCAANELFGSGRLSTMTDESGSTRYCYDRFGHVVRKVQTVTQGSTLTLGTTYNSAGNLVAMTYPSGAVVTYLRDANGRATRVEANPSAGAAQVNIVSAVTYAPFGPLSSMTFGNSRVQSRAYDQDYGIDAVTEDGATDGFTSNYTLDAVGNVADVTERTLPKRTYGYDGLDRVTSATGGASSEAFEYDATGNRTKKIVGATTQVYTYPGTSHRLTAVGASARTYDAAGNTLTIPESGSLAMAYNDHGRLREVKVGGVVRRTYAYNAKGERVLRLDPVAPANNQQFVYDEAGHLLGEYKPDGTRIAEYVWMDDTLVAVLKSFGGTTYQFVLTDHLGTPRAVVAPTTNKVVWRWDLTATAFGDHNANQDPDGDAVLYTFNLRYPGQYWDGLANVYYNYFRDYDARTGRYLQSDPIGLKGGPSTYGYVGGNSLRFSDQYGLIAVTAPVPWWTWLPAAPTWLNPSLVLRGLGWGALFVPSELGTFPCEDIPSTADRTKCFAYSNRARGLPPIGLAPPVPGCVEGPASRPKEKALGGRSLWDPDGGEWRYFPGDRWHNPHWDHNPHDVPNSPWVNVPIGDVPPVKEVPDPKS